MLSQNLLSKLNHQIALEDYSANLYLAMSSWCSYKGLNGAAKFLEAHSDEEHAHMRKIFSYINETGSMAIVSSIEKPPCEFESIKDVFQKTFEHEKFVTKSINELVELCLSEKDYSTFNFLQWYVAEQHEEERLFKNILDMIDIIGLDGRGLFTVDKEIGKLTVK